MESDALDSFSSGKFFAFQAVQIQDTIAGLVSMILLVQALTNTGCCGVSGCKVPTSTKKSNHIQVEYPEIKQKHLNKFTHQI